MSCRPSTHSRSFARSSAARIASLNSDGSRDGRSGDQDSSTQETEVHVSFHAQIVAGAARSAAIDALIVARRVDLTLVTAELTRWRERVRYAHFGQEGPDGVARSSTIGQRPREPPFGVVREQRPGGGSPSCCSRDRRPDQCATWLLGGARGLSVLRTNAASTGAIALKALMGTTAGFFIGVALILAIGTHTAALWVVFPLAVIVAAYAPGTEPFVVGQAAFTVLISVLYNIIIPVGWKVGEIRVEDVAIGGE